jgi:hypothetical protein
MILRDTPGEPVGIRIAARASLAAPVVVVNVQLADATEAVAVPATALSIKAVMLVLTVSPQVPVKSPVVGSANPKRVEKLDTVINMSYCVLMDVQLAV